MNQPGPESKDDRRILSGIMHVIKVGCRWKDCPAEYGPRKTVYNRFARWSEKGVWQKIFEAVVGSSAARHQVGDFLPFSKHFFGSPMRSYWVPLRSIAQATVNS
jgi:transposase